MNEYSLSRGDKNNREDINKRNRIESVPDQNLNVLYIVFSKRFCQNLKFLQCEQVTAFQLHWLPNWTSFSITILHSLTLMVTQNSQFLNVFRSATLTRGPSCLAQRRSGLFGCACFVMSNLLLSDSCRFTGSWSCWTRNCHVSVQSQ